MMVSRSRMYSELLMKTKPAADAFVAQAGLRQRCVDGIDSFLRLDEEQLKASAGLVEWVKLRAEAVLMPPDFPILSLVLRRVGRMLRLVGMIVSPPILLDCFFGRFAGGGLGRGSSSECKVFRLDAKGGEDGVVSSQAEPAEATITASRCVNSRKQGVPAKSGTVPTKWRREARLNENNLRTTRWSTATMGRNQTSFLTSPRRVLRMFGLSRYAFLDLLSISPYAGSAGPEVSHGDVV